MYVLGLSGYAHESSACLLKNGRLIALVEEERLNREKHTSKFPALAIQECLKIENISMEDVDVITFFWQPLREVVGNVGHVLKYFPQSLNLLLSSQGQSEMSFFSRIWAKQNIGHHLRHKFNLKKNPRIVFVEHHLAHAASAYFMSGFNESAILTLDGRGESTTTLLALGRGNKITKLKEIPVPHSLGHLYAAITDYLGFKPFFDEWKVMGMSAYGHDRLVEPVKELVQILKRGNYRLALKYFQFHTHGQHQWLSHRFYKKFGPPRAKDGGYEQRHFDMAFALQKTVEEIVLYLVDSLYKWTKIPNLVMTGGVALNCLMNKRIVEDSKFQNFFFQPIANDAGTSLGSALYFYHHQNHQPIKYQFESIYLGPSYSEDAFLSALQARQLPFRKSNSIAADTAEYLAQNKIVGWFQGCMEAGPRALGNRSILANPKDPTMKDKLNRLVKKREFFRPFAPSVLEEKVFEYFDMPKKQLSPYMILAAEVKADKRSVIPAVTHADNTARVQTVNQKTNPLYWQLLFEFEKLTGVPVLLNTSFNEQEPIVCTPEHAIDCFCRSAFDVLVMGDFIVEKSALLG